MEDEPGAIPRKPYDLPITPDNAEMIDNVGENSNLSNQDSSKSTVTTRRSRLPIERNDEKGIPQYFHQWWDDREMAADADVRQYKRLHGQRRRTKAHPDEPPKPPLR